MFIETWKIAMTLSFMFFIICEMVQGWMQLEQQSATIESLLRMIKKLETTKGGVE